MKKCLLSLLLLVVSPWCVFPSHAVAADEIVAVRNSRNLLDKTVPLSSPAAGQNVPVKNTSSDWLTDPAEIPFGNIQITKLKVGAASIEIHAGERIEDFKVFTLTGPSRLVIEISSAVFRSKTDTVVINKFGISSARIEHHPRFLRIFLDAEYGRIIPYQIEETDTSLNITFTNPSD